MNSILAEERPTARRIRTAFRYRRALRHAVLYSRAALEAAFDEFKRELDGIDSMICYAVKANSNLRSSTSSPRLGAVRHRFASAS